MPIANPEMSVEEKLDAASKYAERFPHISQDDHLDIVLAVYGNYADPEGFEKWYSKLAPVLTEADLAVIRKDPFMFAMTEWFLVPETGRKPLYDVILERGKAA